jgi:hypothetical protein
LWSIEVTKIINKEIRKGTRERSTAMMQGTEKEECREQKEIKMWAYLYVCACASWAARVCRTLCRTLRTGGVFFRHAAGGTLARVGEGWRRRRDAGCPADRRLKTPRKTEIPRTRTCARQCRRR